MSKILAMSLLNSVQDYKKTLLLIIAIVRNYDKRCKIKLKVKLKNIVNLF